MNFKYLTQQYFGLAVEQPRVLVDQCVGLTMNFAPKNS